MSGPTGEDDPPLFVGALRFRGPGVKGWAGTNELEIDGVGTGTSQGSILVSAGTASALRSAFTLSNSNNVSFGINSAGVVTATASVASSLTAIRVSAGTTSNLLSALTFSDSNGLSFGINASTLTASHDGLRTVALYAPNATQSLSVGAATDSTLLGTQLHFPLLASSATTRFSSQNVAFRISSNSLLPLAFQNYFAASGTNQAAQQLSFANSNGISWGISSTTNAIFGLIPIVTASYTVPTHTLAVSAAGNSVSNGTFVLSNSNNVSFGMAGSTITASATVASTQGSIRISAGGSSVLSSGFTFSNSNNVSFGIDAAGVVTGTATVVSTQGSIRISAGTTSVLSSGFTFSDSHNISWTMNNGTLVASATVAATRDIGIVSHIGGNSVASVTRLAFSNASNVTFSLSTAAGAATLLASVNPGGGGGGIAASAAGSSQSAGTVVWSNANNVSFGMNGSTITATVASSLTNIRFSAGTEAFLGSQLSFADSNGFSFGLNVSTITVSARPDIGVVSHVGGNVVSSVTRLAFSNASNVTFSLSTAANAATLLASVATAAGGIAAGDGTATVSTGTLIFTNETSITNFATGSLSVQNVVFDITGQSMGASALMRFQDGTNSTQTGGFLGTKIQFASSNGISFGLATTNDAQGRNVVLTASVAAQTVPTVSWFRNFHLDGDIAETITRANNSCVHFFPLDNFGAFHGNMTISTLDLLMVGHSHTSTQSTGSFGFTLRGALYSLANSSQLTRVNSFSTTLSATTQSSATLNNLYAGGRWITIHSSLWGAQPVLSDGVNYWMALHVSSAGVDVMSGMWAMQANQGAFRGTMNVTTNNVMQQGRAPFWGVFSDSTPPVSLNHVGLVVATSSSQFLNLPALQLRCIANT